MIQLLVFGANGQLAKSIARAALAKAIPCECIGRQRLDLHRETELAGCLDTLLARQPASTIVINTAAYTHVDHAENEKALAGHLNTSAAGAISAACERAGLPILHISTDFVFSGARNIPWTEADMPAPLGIYGTTKWEGEKAVAAANPRHLVIRTAWLLSEYSGNFLTTMLRLGSERSTLSVVGDQVGSPTSSHDLAHALVALAEQVVTGSVEWGIYHFAGPETMSWAELARTIFSRAGMDTQVENITAEAYGAPAPRPAYSALDSRKLKRATGLSHRPLKVSLDEILRRRA